MPPTLRSADSQTMIESAPEAIIVYNFETFLYLNPFAAKRLGADAASLVGQPIMDFVHPESKGLIVERLGQLARTGEGGPAMGGRVVARAGGGLPRERG